MWRRAGCGRTGTGYLISGKRKANVLIFKSHEKNGKIIKKNVM